MARTSKKTSSNIAVNSGFVSFKKIMEDLAAARAQHVKAIQDIDTQVAENRREIMALLGIAPEAKPQAAAPSAPVKESAFPIESALPSEEPAPTRRGRGKKEEEQTVTWDALMKFCKDQDLMGDVRKKSASNIDAVIAVIKEYEWAEGDLDKQELKLLNTIGANIITE